MEIELGLNNSFAPVEDILYLSRILYSAPSNGDWGELELDYILFLRSGETPVLTPIQRGGGADCGVGGQGGHAGVPQGLGGGAQRCWHHPMG